MKVLFLLQIACLLVLSITAIIKKQFKYKDIVRIVSLSVTVLLGIVVYFSHTALSAVALGMGIGALVSFFLYIFSCEKRVKEGIANTALFASKALLVILLLEALVFNFNSFHLWGGNYEQFDLSLKDATYVNGVNYTVDAANELKGSGFEAEFLGIDKEIGTIYLDVESSSGKISYDIDFADESNSSYYIRSGLVKGDIYPDIEQSKYIICNFSGDVSKIKINLTAQEGESLSLLSDTIKCNADYPSTFSLLRVLVFLLSSVFVFLFVRAVFMKRSIGAQVQNLKAVTALIVVACLTLMVFMTVIECAGTDILHLTDGNQMTKELVDAFKKGRVTLDTTPSDELLSLPNPYDWSQRLESNVYALWDHVLYEGEYYSYYGIGPVLLLFLPYNLITGYYFPSAVATFLFSAVGLTFLALTFMKLCKRYFSNIPMSMYVVSLFMILSSCGIWYCLIPSNFYEIAQTSGFCFVTLGAYFMVSANVFDKGRIKLVNLCLSTLFLSIAVTCRPTTAVWCVVALLFIGVGVIKIHRNKKAQEYAPSYVKYLLCALLPFVVIGAGQMIYNYIRFDSFTDFGIQYSLTINDFTKAQYHTQFAAIGFYNYLFAPPSFSSTFPFVMTNITDLDVNGYYFTATSNGCGLLYRALPTFALFLYPMALKYIKKENRAIVTVLFLAVAVAAPCVIIFSIWESGYGVRYMVDFAWQMLMCAIFVIFVLYNNTKFEETKRIYRCAMLLAMFMCVVVNFALTYSYIYPDNLPQFAHTMFEKIARSFSIFNT